MSQEPRATHDHSPDVRFDGGDLDCGNGLLLLIRRHIDPMDEGQLLEILNRDTSVESDLPAWCRMTGNDLVSWTRVGTQRSYLISKGSLQERSAKTSEPRPAFVPELRKEVVIPTSLPEPVDAPEIKPLSIMSIGSWPRPKWLLRNIHDRVAGRLGDSEFQEAADDAVRLCVNAQLDAGVDVLTDGEQRRDSYSSFVGHILDNCQLIPLTDLTAMVDDPDKFAEELRALDVPAEDVRHPVAFGRLGRSRPIALHEARFLRGLSELPIKVALPGPYLLTRTMWLDCLEDRAYETREELARDVVRVLREELHHLLAAGVSLVQFDEPVLTEVVFSPPTTQRSFMCGALSEKGRPEEELTFAYQLLNDVIRDLPRERTAVHICRGNWTKDENALLTGDYRALAPYLTSVEAGTLFLEMSTPRAGELDAIGGLELSQRIGLGVVNPRSDRVETVDEIRQHAEKAGKLFGLERLLLNSDCGFATFADNPVASQEVASAKLAAMKQAAESLRG